MRSSQSFSGGLATSTPRPVKQSTKQLTVPEPFSLGERVELDLRKESPAPIPPAEKQLLEAYCQKLFAEYL
jgi:hypothetical protein